MLKKIIEKTITGSAIAVGVFGVAWIVNRTLIDFFRMKEMSYEIGSRSDDINIATRRYYLHQASYYGEKADSAERIDSGNPINIVSKYGRDFYERHFGSNGHR